MPAPVYWMLHAIGLRRADTQTTAAERRCLVRHAAGRKMLVEIGVMHGASTRLLCGAMHTEGTLVAIDPFPPGRLGVSFELAIARREVSRGPKRDVIWRREPSEQAAADWTAAIDFLFVDGDHSWRGISQDWTAWSRFMVAGGLVALHDSHAVAGRASLDSVRYTEEVILSDSRFEFVERVDSLTVMRRLHSTVARAPQMPGA